MQAKHLVVLVLALIALATGTFFLLVDRGHDAPASPPGASDAVAPDDGRPAPAAATGALPTAGGDAAAAAALSADAQRSEIAASSPDGGRGAELRGRLVDRAGAPRADVEVAVRTFRPLGTLVVPMRDLAGENESALPRRRTDRDGRFVFDLPGDTAGELLLRTPGLVFERDDRMFDLRQGTVDLGDVRVLREASIAGVVVDAAGQPVADVRVAAGRGGLGIGSRTEAKTAADGAFSLGMLAPGAWHVRTASGRFLPAVEKVELKAEEQRTGLRLVVETGQAVAGIVVDDLGRPVPDLQVGSSRRENSDGAVISRFSPDEATRTDANGYFTLAGLVGETATVRAFGAGYSTAILRDVRVGTGDLVLRVTRHGRVAGVLRDAAGQPIADSRVRAVPPGAEPGELRLEGDLPILEQDEVVRTAADGSFVLDSVPPGTVRLVASGDGHRPARRDGVTVVPGQLTSGMDLVADSGATVRALVTDERGAAVAGARVVVAAPRAADGGPAGGAFVGRRVRIGADEDGGAMVIDDGDREHGSGTTGADGIVEIHGLPAGAVEVAATHEAFAAARPVALVLPAAGAVEAKLHLRQAGHAELVALLADGQPGALGYRVRGPLGSAEPDAEHTGQTKAGGAARIGPLVPGDYEAELLHAPRARSLGGAMFIGEEREPVRGTRTTFAVVAGETTRVELRMPVLTRVFGTATGAEGPVAGIEVELEPADGRAGPQVPGLGGGLSARTGADGGYSIADVEPGSYRVRWGKRSQLAKATDDLLVPNGVPDLQHDLALRYGRLRVQVVEAGSGAPIAGAEVQLAAGGGGTQRTERRMMTVSMVMRPGQGPGEMASMTVGDTRVETDADGVAVIEDVPPGTWTVRVTHDRHAPGRIADQVVTERATTDAGRIELGAAGRIRANVVDAAGNRVPMALVHWRKVGDRGEAQRQPAMGGNLTLSGLEPGRYLLTAERIAMGGGAPAGRGPEVEVEVKAGELADGVELRLPR